MTAAAPSPWPRVRAELDRAGIPAREVRSLGVTASGYWGRDGEWHTWPSLGVGVAVLEALVRDREDMAARS